MADLDDIDISLDGTVSDDIADPAAATHDARYMGDGAMVVVQKGHDLHVSAPVDLLDLLELAGDRFRAEGKFRLELAAHQQRVDLLRVLELEPLVGPA